MSKYRLPIQVISYIEVEAETLEDAITDIHNGTPDVPGIDLSKVSDWEVDRWQSIFKNEEELLDKDGISLYLSDITDHTKY